MSIFDLFAPKNPFETFAGKIVRLQALLSVMKQEASKEHFEQLKGHFTAVKNLIGSQTALNPRCLLRLLDKEKQVTKALPDSEQKAKLASFEAEVETAFGSIVVTVQDSVNLCDKAISSLKNPTELIKYKAGIKEKVQFMERVADAIKQRALVEVKLYTKLKQKKIIEPINLPDPLNLQGSMSNGWKVSDIQRVVRQLGGYILKTSGKHPYKIIFPSKQVSFAFTSTMEPHSLARQVATPLGLTSTQIEHAFAAGEFVNQ